MNAEAAVASTVGASLVPVIVKVTVSVAVAPLMSVAVTVNEKVIVSPAARKSRVNVVGGVVPRRAARRRRIGHARREGASGQRRDHDPPSAYRHSTRCRCCSAEMSTTSLVSMSSKLTVPLCAQILRAGVQILGERRGRRRVTVGASLVPVIVKVTVSVAVAPLMSVAVTVNEKVIVSPAAGSPGQRRWRCSSTPCVPGAAASVMLAEKVPVVSAAI